MNYSDLTSRIGPVGGDGFERLRWVRVAIAGISRIGGRLALALVQFGFEWFVFIDPDDFEDSNAGGPDFFEYGPGKKVYALARRLMAYNPQVRITAIPKGVESREACEAVLSSHVVIASADSPRAAGMVNMYAAYGGIPAWRLGAGVRMENGRVVASGCEIIPFLPGTPCLVCRGLDPSVPRMTGQPSMTSNSMKAAAFCCDQVLEYFCPWGGTIRELRIDSMAGEIHHAAASPETQKAVRGRQAKCVFCGPESRRYREQFLKKFRPGG